MEITNKLLSKSFSYQQSGEALTCRIEEQEKLNEILEFCRDIDEVVCNGKQCDFCRNLLFSSE